jgi:hypothetical protein
MAPSTIPPTATLEDFIFPREGIQFGSGRYGGWSGNPRAGDSSGSMPACAFDRRPCRSPGPPST